MASDNGRTGLVRLPTRSCLNPTSFASRLKVRYACEFLEGGYAGPYLFVRKIPYVISCFCRLGFLLGVGDLT
jgi:hypothetical protein